MMYRQWLANTVSVVRIRRRRRTIRCYPLSVVKPSRSRCASNAVYRSESVAP
jgi:hypothetical protein